jgi:hypothetical protein
MDTVPKVVNFYVHGFGCQYDSTDELKIDENRNYVHLCNRNTGSIHAGIIRRIFVKDMSDQDEYILYVYALILRALIGGFCVNLSGHSYGGSVVTRVAQRLLQDIDAKRLPQDVTLFIAFHTYGSLLPLGEPFIYQAKMYHLLFEQQMYHGDIISYLDKKNKYDNVIRFQNPDLTRIGELHTSYVERIFNFGFDQSNIKLEHSNNAIRDMMSNMAAIFGQYDADGQRHIARGINIQRRTVEGSVKELATVFRDLVQDSVKTTIDAERRRIEMAFYHFLHELHKILPAQATVSIPFDRPLYNWLNQYEGTLRAGGNKQSLWKQIKHRLRLHPIERTRSSFKN